MRSWKTLALAGSLVVTTSACPTDGDVPRHWVMEANDALMIGGYGDNMQYDGGDIRPGAGFITLDVDAEENTGDMAASWTGTHTPELGVTYTGRFDFVLDHWMEMEPYQDGGIVENLSIHGATGRSTTAMPEVMAFLGGWAMCNVFLDDVQIYTRVHCHWMYTDGARGEDHRIVQADGVTTYDPGDPVNAYVDPDDRELHLVVHSIEEDPNNYPPNPLWLHMNFEEPVVTESPPGAPL